MNWQPTDLKNEKVCLIPLKEADFEELYSVASDPLIWEQHPNKNRYQRNVFLNFFEGAIQSKGAFIIRDTQTGEAIGSSRFYNYDADASYIEIGYTFFARKYWGKSFNKAVKELMIHYAFQLVNSVHFFIGAENYRSQKAIEKLGAKKIRELVMPYYGEPDRLNFEYEIKKTGTS